jgi:hypothetical protein
VLYLLDFTGTERGHRPYHDDWERRAAKEEMMIAKLILIGMIYASLGMMIVTKDLTWGFMAVIFSLDRIYYQLKDQK